MSVCAQHKLVMVALALFKQNKIKFYRNVTLAALFWGVSIPSPIIYLMS